MTDINKEHNHSEKDKEKAHNKRVKEEKSFTIVAVILYSVFLMILVVASYVGVRIFIKNSKAKQEAAALAAAELAKEEQVIEEEQIEEPVEEVEPEMEAGEWKDVVFSRLENPKDPKNALINTYNFTRMVSENDSGHAMDYAVYSDDSGLVEKITTTENCGDLFEIIDYYFDNGNINYIAQYSEAVDIPIDVSTAAVESRYYFANDKLVRYIYCEEGKAYEYSIEDIKDYSDGTVDQYYYMEEMMLEKAKATWDTAKDVNSTVTVEGYVLDEYNQALKENKVTLIDADGNVSYETKTDGDGKYSIEVKADDNKEYTLRAERNTLIDVNVYGIKAKNGDKKISVPTIYMAYSDVEMPYNYQLFIKDADDANIAITDADIKFRNGLNAREGDVFLSGNLGEFGYISPQLRSGSYTAEVIKDGYETLYINFVVKPDHIGTVAYAVKDVAEDEFKAVINWEANPLDIDIRCFSSSAANILRSNADSVGSTTAEVIDIKDAGSDAYYFYVSDFTNTAIDNYMAYGLTDCNAQLALYDKDGLVYTYPVPAAHAGVVWKPLEIRNGKVYVVNDYYTSIGTDSIFKKK